MNVSNGNSPMTFTGCELRYELMSLPYNITIILVYTFFLNLFVSMDEWHPTCHMTNI